MRIFWQLRWYFQLKWKQYVGSILLFAVISALQLVPPKAVGIIVDGVVDNTLETSTLVMWLLGLIVLFLRYMAVEYCGGSGYLARVGN